MTKQAEPGRLIPGEMKEGKAMTIKELAEVVIVQNKYGISPENMAEIIKAHGGNVKAAIKTVEAIAKLMKR